MAEPARKIDSLPTPPSVRVNASNASASRRERANAERLEEVKNRARIEFANAQLPALISSITDQSQNQENENNEISDDQRTEIIDSLKRRYQSDDSDPKNSDSKKRTGLGALRQARRDLADIRKLLRGRDIGLFGLIMFTIMGGISLFLDVLPFVTGDLSSIIDWIFDAGFFFLLFITMLVMTGEVLRTMFGFRGVINLAQTILEFIPASDLVPWHTVAVIVLYLDVKYDIVKIVKNLRKGELSPESTKAPT